MLTVIEVLKTCHLLTNHPQEFLFLTWHINSPTLEKAYLSLNRFYCFLNFPHLSVCTFLLHKNACWIILNILELQICHACNEKQIYQPFDPHISVRMPFWQYKITELSPSPLWLPNTFQFWGISRLAMAKATRRSMAQRELSWPKLKRLLSSLWSIEFRQCPWITRCSARSWEKSSHE